MFYDGHAWTENPHDTLEAYFGGWDSKSQWSLQIRVSLSSAPHVVNLT
jgi:hypothetical protein